MRIDKICIRNFRRLENVQVDIEDKETVFVGPNNSGKTSATAIVRCFLGGREFRIHDFSVSKVQEINEFGQNGGEVDLPGIELDLWFTIDPDGIEFGRAFSLLPGLAAEYTKIGVRMRFGAIDNDKLRAEYIAAFPAVEEVHAKSLSQFLGMDKNLKRLFGVSYASLEVGEAGVVAKPLDPSEGAKLMHALVRVDFVDAQRNIDDAEEHRSNKLSAAFAAYYRKNLQVPEVATAAYAVIDANNTRLTEHYEEQFGGLMTLIKGLGIPSINDRGLKLVSALSPEAALQGNTELYYVDPANDHELPEMYNGLGFKNLIYMAIQAKHFHAQWSRTPVNRPLCQLIFIEEPEVHLHAQVQQTFISKIWAVLDEAAKAEQDDSLVAQLVITTHSSHILEAVDFAKVRYFRRCSPLIDGGAAGVLNVSQVHSLRTFQPEVPPVAAAGGAGPAEPAFTPEQTLAFLKRYLRLTHCDLFFADAAILVEGAVEKLLLPAMIEKVAPRLNQAFLTTMEVGGAYAHRFEGLLAFLHIPYLVITDLDSVEAAGQHPACRADTLGALTSNASLKHFLQLNTVGNLELLTAGQKEHVAYRRYVTFQMEEIVVEPGLQQSMKSRTLEEAFVHRNFSMYRSGQLSLGFAIPEALPDAYEAVYQRVKSDKFKKTDFAMEVLACQHDWQVPAYIAEGLTWLENKLVPVIEEAE